MEKFRLLAVVFAFETGLRILTFMTRDESGKSKYPLLSPIYFCGIPPFFYLCDGAWKAISGTRLSDDYFFPPLTNSNTGVLGCLNEDVWKIFHIIDMSNVSLTAVMRSIPTMIALVLFSLIHVPINIPAFAVSSNVDVDMNAELIAHGYSNGIAGLVGGMCVDDSPAAFKSSLTNSLNFTQGLQNYMAYTQSMIYYKSGGNGRSSSLAVALCTTFLFFVGPQIASYLPRCMAGTLLLHCGIDLFMEGVYDSIGKYDCEFLLGISRRISTQF